MSELKEDRYERLKNIRESYWKEFFERLTEKTSIPKPQGKLPKPLNLENILITMNDWAEEIIVPFTETLARIEKLSDSTGMRRLLTALMQSGEVVFFEQDISQMQPAEFALMMVIHKERLFEIAEDMTRVSAGPVPKSFTFSEEIASIDTKDSFLSKIRDSLLMLVKEEFEASLCWINANAESGCAHFIVMRIQDTTAKFIDHIIIDPTNKKVYVTTTQTNSERINEKYGHYILTLLEYINSRSEDVEEESQQTVRTKQTDFKAKDIDEEYAEIKKEKDEFDPKNEIVAESLAFLRIFTKLNDARELDGNILLLGETGVGKTYLVEMLQENISGETESVPFEKYVVQAGGSDSNFQRRKLFGIAEKSGIQNAPKEGAAGYIEMAKGGFLYIDELIHINKDLIAELLLALEGKPVERFGGSGTKVETKDVRFICATNADKKSIEDMIGKDFFHRFRSEIPIPPLRERKRDLIPLAKLFIKGYLKRQDSEQQNTEQKADAEQNRSTKQPDIPISDEVKLALFLHPWEGNVRELEACITKAAYVSRKQKIQEIQITHLPESMKDAMQKVMTLEQQGNLEKELWKEVHNMFQDEGYRKNHGLQKKVGEWFGLGESPTSKRYSKYELK